VRHISKPRRRPAGGGYIAATNIEGAGAGALGGVDGIIGSAAATVARQAHEPGEKRVFTSTTGYVAAGHVERLVVAALGWRHSLKRKDAAQIPCFVLHPSRPSSFKDLRRSGGVQ
jgi:hypothetical protein